MKVLARNTSCPACGSESRVVENRVAEEIEAGRLPEGFKTGALISQTTLFNPKHETILASREVPVVMSLYDVCSDCGNMYAVEMLEHTILATPHVNQTQKKGDGNGGGFPWNIN